MSTIISLQEWLDENPTNSKVDQRLFLTEAEVRSFTPFKDLKAEDIQHLIATIHELALVSYEMFCRETNNCSMLQRAA